MVFDDMGDHPPRDVGVQVGRRLRVYVQAPLLEKLGQPGVARGHVRTRIDAGRAADELLEQGSEQGHASYIFSVSPPRGCQTSSRRSANVTAQSSSRAK